MTRYAIHSQNQVAVDIYDCLTLSSCLLIVRRSTLDDCGGLSKTSLSMDLWFLSFLLLVLGLDGLGPSTCANRARAVPLPYPSPSPSDESSSTPTGTGFPTSLFVSLPTPTEPLAILLKSKSKPKSQSQPKPIVEIITIIERIETSTLGVVGPSPTPSTIPAKCDGKGNVSL